MHVRELRRVAKPEHAVDQLKANRPDLHHKGHVGPITTTRKDLYKGREIEIKTMYEITVDGKWVGGHLGVGNDGRVHYHPLPNYSSGSAVELVQRIIDSFPDEFPEPARKQRRRQRTKAASTMRERRR